MILIEALHLSRQCEDLAGDSPGTFPGKKCFRPCELPKVFHRLLMLAEQHSQSLDNQHALHLGFLACASASPYFHTSRLPAVPAMLLRLGCPACSSWTSSGQVPGPWPGSGAPLSQKPWLQREGKERALGLCSTAWLCTACVSNSFPQNVCDAVIYFAAYD